MEMPRQEESGNAHFTTYAKVLLVGKVLQGILNESVACGIFYNHERTCCL